MFEMKWDWVLTVLKSSILEKKVGGNEFTPTTIYPIFRNFQVDFSIFLKTEYVRDEWSGCCSEVTFSKITPWGATRLPQTFLNSKKLPFSNIYRPKTVQARMI